MDSSTCVVTGEVSIFGTTAVEMRTRCVYRHYGELPVVVYVVAEPKTGNTIVQVTF